MVVNPTPRQAPLSRRNHSQPRVELPVAQEPDITWTPARGSTPGASWWCDNPQLLPHLGGLVRSSFLLLSPRSTRCAMPRDWDDGKFALGLAELRNRVTAETQGYTRRPGDQFTEQGASCDDDFRGLFVTASGLLPRAQLPQSLSDPAAAQLRAAAWRWRAAECEGSLDSLVRKCPKDGSIIPKRRVGGPLPKAPGRLN